jgi:hypothetical protein
MIRVVMSGAPHDAGAFIIHSEASSFMSFEASFLMDSL